MARSWFATSTKIGPFTATWYHALRGTSLIGILYKQYITYQAECYPNINCRHTFPTTCGRGGRRRQMIGISPCRTTWLMPPRTLCSGIMNPMNASINRLGDLVSYRKKKALTTNIRWFCFPGWKYLILTMRFNILVPINLILGCTGRITMRYPPHINWKHIPRPWPLPARYCEECSSSSRL